MKYYPICLDIQDKRCVVIGGGEVGERKALRLLACGASVCVISKELAPELRKLKAAGRISHVDDHYDRRHLKGAFLAIGATNREDVNDRIAGDCRDQGILVNIVDDPRRCDFILPALLSRGDLSIAVSTDGKSPALAGKIRRDLSVLFGREYESYLDLLGYLRKRVMDAGGSADVHRDIFTALVNSPLLAHLRAGRREEAEQVIRDLTAQEIDLNVFLDGAGKEATS